MKKVFVSYVHEDEAVALAVQHLIKDALKVRDVFMSSDKTQVFAGDHWLTKITDSLRQAEIVILMLSRRSVNRPWVNFEAGAAWLTNKRIIPVCYGNMTKEKLPHPYSAIQALNLESQPDYLLQSVCHHLGMPIRQWDESDDVLYTRGIFEALDAFQDITGHFVTKTKTVALKPSKPNSKH